MLYSFLKMASKRKLNTRTWAEKYEILEQTDNGTIFPLSRTK